MTESNPPVRIEPTVGRMVLFHLNGTSPLAAAQQFYQLNNDIYAAIIAYVPPYDKRWINLTVFDHYGNPFGRTCIPLVQEGEPLPDGAYCEWMPYQRGQAQKTEQLERKVAELRAGSDSNDASGELHPHPAIANAKPIDTSNLEAPPTSGEQIEEDDGLPF